MNKKIVSIFVMLILMLSTVNVNASDFWEIYGAIEKGNNSGELYNLMPTTLEKNKEFSVKIAVKNIKGWELLNGAFRLSWDKEAFEIVDEKGKYFSIIDENARWVSTNLVMDNGINVYFQYDSVPYEDTIRVIELKFKTKKNVKDGFYNIYLEPSNNLGIDVNGEYMDARIDDTVLKYQIGKPALVSSYSKDEIENSSYVIGEYLFTHSEPTAEYDGSLTTEYIMLASQSIKSQDKNDMIIYGKSIKKGWVNAITDESVAVPDEFKIKYVNMKASYQENGIYSSDDDKTILRLIQINDKEAIVTIENEKEKVHGFANIQNRVATLKVADKSYTVTIKDEGVSIESSDNYIGNVDLVKRSNYSINDYYDEYYSFHDDIGGSKEYLNSVHTGKYTSENYDLYLYRINERIAKVCIKEKGKSNCLINTIVENNEDGSFLGADYETTYAFLTDESSNGIDWNSEKITLTCEGNCSENPFVGVYSKETTLTMEDVIKAWEENKVYYRVLFNKGNGEDANYFYAEPNVPLDNYSEVWSYFDDHYKEGSLFVEWRYNNINGSKFNIEDTITGPVTLLAYYESLPAKPTLTLSNPNGEFNSQIGEFEYNFVIESSADYDGVELRQKSDNSVVETVGKGVSNIRLMVIPNISITYYAMTYKVIDSIKYYSDPSEEITINPIVYTVKFNVNGGTSIPDQQLSYGQKVTKPTNPTKNGFVFDEWQLNGVTYDFESPVESSIILTAVWKRALAAPTLSSELDGTGWNKLTVTSAGNYASESAISGIDGMAIYAVDGDIYTSIYDGQELSYLVKNTSKNLIARVYTIVDNERVWSEYSNILTINNVIPAPVIGMGTNGTSTNERIRALYFDKQHNAFEMDLFGDYSIHTKSGCTGNDCYSVDDYRWFEKNGNELTQVYDGGIGGVAEIYIPEGSSKTFVAKAYTTAYNGDIVYSSESNEITIDLTNPTYTYEMIESQTDNTKYIVRAYINNYEVSFEQIIINGSDYPDEGGDAEFDVSKEDIDSEGNITSLTLQLSDDMFVVATKR